MAKPGITGAVRTVDHLQPIVARVADAQRIGGADLPRLVSCALLVAFALRACFALACVAQRAHLLLEARLFVAAPQLARATRFVFEAGRRRRRVGRRRLQRTQRRRLLLIDYPAVDAQRQQRFDVACGARASPGVVVLTPPHALDGIARPPRDENPAVART